MSTTSTINYAVQIVALTKTNSGFVVEGTSTKLHTNINEMITILTVFNYYFFVSKGTTFFL